MPQSCRGAACDRRGCLLWTPTSRVERAHLTRFMRWLDRERGRRSTICLALALVVEDLEGFWIPSGSTSGSAPACRRSRRSVGDLQGAEWFPAVVSITRERAGRARPGHEAMVHFREGQAGESFLGRTHSGRAAARAALRGSDQQRRPGRRLFAEHADAVVAMLATTYRSDLVGLRSGFVARAACSTLLAAHTKADVLLRRLSLRRQGLRASCGDQGIVEELQRSST